MAIPPEQLQGSPGTASGRNGDWLPKPARIIEGRKYLRYTIRTHLIESGEDLVATLAPYLEGRVAAGDVVVVGEKIVAISEGRAVPLSAVHPRPLARWLSRHVRQLGYGMGLRRPETMEMAMREVGSIRVLLGAVAGAVDRVVGRSGDFYRIAGRAVAAIDGPGPTTIPPYNEYIVLGPKHPADFCRRLAECVGAGVAVVDVNDVGSEVLATSAGVDAGVVVALLRDNPMGQGKQRTPLGVLRRARTAARLEFWPAARWEGVGATLVLRPGEGPTTLGQTWGPVK